MRAIEDIKSRVPYIRTLASGMYATELTLANQKGSVIFDIGHKWEHVSFAPYNQKNPSWDAMSQLKDVFFEDEELVIQMHPKKSEYVNLKDNCLHLWRRQDVEDLIEANM